MRRRWHRRFESFPKSRPRATRGGIKAQSKRGTFGESWWAQRWIHVLESFNIGGRLARGRTYARTGQVVSIDIEKGHVTAKVQGSRPKPYDVKIALKPLSDADWKKVAAALSHQALFAAKLLAGEMPQDIEQVFKTAKLSLFPGRLGDLKTNCSCPDWSNPCKHIAAVYYLLGEEFDRDPFLIFKLRGSTREELVAQLTGGQAAPVEGQPPAAESTAEPAAPRGRRRRRKAEPLPAPAEEPLPADPAAFWSSPALPPDFLGTLAEPEAAAALVQRLGGFPFWRGNEPFLESMQLAYRAAAPLGAEAYLGSLGANRLT